MHSCTCVHICARIYTYTHIHTNRHADIQTYGHTDVHVHAKSYYVHVYIYIHTYETNWTGNYTSANMDMFRKHVIGKYSYEYTHRCICQQITRQRNKHNQTAVHMRRMGDT